MAFTVVAHEGVSDAIKAEVTRYITDISALAPAKQSVTVEIFAHMDDDPCWREKGVQPTTEAATDAVMRDRVSIYLDNLESPDSIHPHAGHFMPVRQKVSPLEYATVHEWGHVTDPRPIDNSKDTEWAMMFGLATTIVSYPKVACESMSCYGQSFWREAYAEAFTEWHLTEGITTNASAKWFAHKFHWHTF